jgi:hypothetical protein
MRQTTIASPRHVVPDDVALATDHYADARALRRGLPTSAPAALRAAVQRQLEGSEHCVRGAVAARRPDGDPAQPLGTSVGSSAGARADRRSSTPADDQRHPPQLSYRSSIRGFSYAVHRPPSGSPVPSSRTRHPHGVASTGGPPTEPSYPHWYNRCPQRAPHPDVRTFRAALGHEFPAGPHPSVPFEDTVLLLLPADRPVT